MEKDVIICLSSNTVSSSLSMNDGSIIKIIGFSFRSISTFHNQIQLKLISEHIHFFYSKAFPLDGGTDNGFTFTSPNWATEPQGEVFTITSDYPAHPAGSFNYPHLARLPILAVYSLTKVRRHKIFKHNQCI